LKPEISRRLRLICLQRNAKVQLLISYDPHDARDIRNARVALHNLPVIKEDERIVSAVI
jgi:hypothetical protein